jgi:hypothetical protein
MYRLPPLDGAASPPEGSVRPDANPAGHTCPNVQTPAAPPAENPWTRVVVFAMSTAVLMMLYFSGVTFLTALGWTATGTATLLSICWGLPRVPGLIGRYKVSRRTATAYPATIPDQGRP